MNPIKTGDEISMDENTASASNENDRENDACIIPSDELEIHGFPKTFYDDH